MLHLTPQDLEQARREFCVREVNWTDETHGINGTLCNTKQTASEKKNISLLEALKFYLLTQIAH